LKALRGASGDISGAAKFVWLPLISHPHETNMNDKTNDVGQASSETALAA
jgi:hypothetical protein